MPKLYEYKLGYFHAKYVFIKNGVKNHKNILENSGALLSCANKENQSRKIQNDIQTLFGIFLAGISKNLLSFFIPILVYTLIKTTFGP